MATRRGFLRLLGIGAAAASALPQIIEALARQPKPPIVRFNWGSFADDLPPDAGFGYASVPNIAFLGDGFIPSTSSAQAAFDVEKLEGWTHGPASDF